MVDKSELGTAAEKKGEKYLKKIGYKILARNYSGQFGEVDLIAKDKKDIVFVEIKFRSSFDFGRPEEFVDKKKQLKIIKTAIHYLKTNKLTSQNVRFDILALGPDIDKIELIKAAFESPSFYKY